MCTRNNFITKTDEYISKIFFFHLWVFIALAIAPFMSKAITLDTDLLVVDRIGRDINGDTIADSTLSVVYRVNAGDYRPDSIWGYGCTSAYQPVYLTESGDFDGDGFEDLVLVEHYGQDVNGDSLGDNSYLSIIDGITKGVVWNISGDGDSAGIYLLQSADFNNDGFDDLAVGTHYGDDVSNPPDNIYDNTWIRVYIGSVNGLVGNESNYWHSMIGHGNGFGYFYLESGDYNGDGYDDLATLRHSWTDITGDGIADHAYIQIFSGGQDGLAESPYWTHNWWDGENINSGPYLLATGNINGDKAGDNDIDDLVVVRYDGTDVSLPPDSILDGSVLRVYKGDFSGILSQMWELGGFPSGHGCYMIDVGDFNNDNFDDLVVVRYSGIYDQSPHDGIMDDSYLRVFTSIALSPDTLWRISSPLPGKRFILLNTGDYNGDNYDDIAVARRSGAGYRNTYLRIFSGEATITPEYISPADDSGDWEIDGKWDSSDTGMGQILLEKLDNTISLQETSHPRLLFTDSIIDSLRSRPDWSAKKWDQLKDLADSLLDPEYLPLLDTAEHILRKYEAAIMALSFVYNFDTTAAKNNYATKAKEILDSLIAGWPDNNIIKTGIIDNEDMGKTTKQIRLGMYIEALAIGYDWIFHELPSAQREDIENILEECTDFIEYLNDVYYGVYNNHTMWHAVPVLYAGVVLPESLGGKYLLSMKLNVINKVFCAIEEMSEKDGGWHEGPMYYMIMELPRIGQFCEAWRVAMHEDFFTGDSVRSPSCLIDGFGFLQHAGEYISLFTTPDWLFMRTGDIGQTSAVFEDAGYGNIASPGHGLIGGYFLQLIANRCQISHPTLASYAQWYAEVICEDLNHQFEDFSKVNNIYSLLWETDIVSAVAPPHLTRHFEGIGNVILRSEASDDAVIVRFACGDFFNNHDHHDQNSFTIYYKGNLAIDAGYYGKGGAKYNSEPERNFQGVPPDVNIGYPNFHNLNYSWRTVAHNSILAFKDPNNTRPYIDDDDQPFAWRYGSDEYADSLIDDGGQFFVNRCRGYQDNDPFFERGNILYVKDASSIPANNWYTIVRGDASDAYMNNSSGVNVLPTFRRDLVLIRPSNGDYNSYVIIFDNINYAPDTATNAELSWLLNISEDASVQYTTADSSEIYINGPERSFSQIANNWPKPGQYSGNLYLKRLFPPVCSTSIHHKINFKVGSFNESLAGPHFNLDTTKIDSLIAGSHPHMNRDIGGQRLEITTTNAGSNYFLNVLYPVEGELGMPECELINSEKHVGSYIKSNENRYITFLFGKNEQPCSTTSYSVQNYNVPTKHVISDLISNSRYRVVYSVDDGKRQLLTYVNSSDEGIIEFQSSIPSGYVEFYVNRIGNIPGRGPFSESEMSLPKVYKLFNNYPNPFYSSTIIAYDLPKKSKVSLKIYDILGRVTKTFISSEIPAGSYRVIWDGTDNNGVKVASGVYFFQIVANDFTDVKKIIKIRKASKRVLR